MTCSVNCWRLSVVVIVTATWIILWWMIDFIIGTVKYICLSIYGFVFRCFYPLSLFPCIHRYFLPIILYFCMSTVFNTKIKSLSKGSKKETTTIINVYICILLLQCTWKMIFFLNIFKNKLLSILPLFDGLWLDSLPPQSDLWWFPVAPLTPLSYCW